MPIGSDPLSELAIPDGTTVEEHDLVTDGDVIIGGQSTVEFGVRGRSVIADERVRFGGHIEAEGDCRLDMWCDVEDNVLVGEDAYIGERVHIGGELRVAGDLDIGDDVDIENGFEANGWIVIRNPMPTIVFLFVYLSQLLRIGEDEAAQSLVDEMLGDDADDHDPILVPRGASVSDDAWRVSTPATIGDDCRLHGNIRAESMEVGRDNVVFGSLRAREDVVVGKGTEIKGDVTTRNGDVRVGPGTKVWGDISAKTVELHENATVDGKIRARDGTRMHTDEVLDRPDESAAAMAEMAEELERDGADEDGETADAADAVDAADGDESAPSEQMETDDDDEKAVDGADADDHEDAAEATD
ncbi:MULTISPECIES: polymer-forming cytoskeletal protein [Haloarcula]|uniref:Acyltransferase n=1 Tax=Haloarcula pellucida TaxID=1427151 RepID=A0A830GH98_9EURY|nr:MULTISPECIES: polymer-forming cytoskeletal protein [Halomicroarcula]MBX0347018.1 polymer-forming cytoskeletal protein [Halomicroarcula pellucida]MDS0277107.1 polymer-forming cytoskeletal protein [Halomicroarcula sp. S1AR25-4]GGN86566.1 acyltransferase [Halomicroarcula pellucida]